MLPGRSVRRNVSFPLEIRSVERDEADERVGAELRAHHIEDLAARPAEELSRGEQQIVQTARVLVRQPRLLLLDEPLTAVDEPRRARFRSELRALQAGYGVTTVMATNDALDAMTMPSRLIVLDAGRVIQDAAPLAVHAAPASLGAAIATGPLSVLRVAVGVRDVEVFVGLDAGGSRVRWTTTGVALVDRIGDEVLLAVRPDDLEPVPVDDPRADVVAVVDRVIAVPHRTLQCRIGGQSLQAASGSTPPQPGSVVAFRIARAHLVDPTSERVIPR